MRRSQTDLAPSSYGGFPGLVWHFGTLWGFRRDCARIRGRRGLGAGSPGWGGHGSASFRGGFGALGGIGIGRRGGICGGRAKEAERSRNSAIWQRARLRLTPSAIGEKIRSWGIRHHITGVPETDKAPLFTVAVEDIYSISAYLPMRQLHVFRDLLGPGSPLVEDASVRLVPDFEDVLTNYLPKFLLAHGLCPILP